jgi:spermidine/putrescine transport system ATP-binding protein
MPDAGASTPVIAFRDVTKRFGDVVAAADLNLEVAAGEFLSFLGPSGCGKTTSLRMIAGFEQPSEGDVFLAGERVNDIPAYRRPVNMVFQHYALFPHLDVADNIAYGLRQQSPRPAAAEIARRVADTLELVRLEGYERRRVWELSGGQQQRVALARALINKPKVLLLDEPLAALDRKLRREMQIELQNLQRSVGITFILVTHDQEEALSMSDRVCIMREGRIVQTGSPRALYDEPVSRYVADFVGRSNFFPGIVRKAGTSSLEVALDCGIAVAARSPATAAPVSAGERVALSVRPEQIVLARRKADISGRTVKPVAAAIRNRIFLGEHTEYLVHNERLGEFLVMAPRQMEISEAPFDVGDTAFVTWRSDAALALAAT